MAEPKVLTGFEYALVNVAPNVMYQDGIAYVSEGEALPDGVSANELERLTALGAFAEHPRHDEAARRAYFEATNGGPADLVTR